MTTNRIEKILVPIALTQEGRIAIEQAVKFKNVFGSGLIIMNIIPEEKLINRILGKGDPAKVLDKAYHHLEEFVRKVFRGEIPDFVNLQVRQGSLIPTILQASKDFSSQMIIIKKSKRIIGKFASFRVNNADKLISQSFCPVLTISENFTHDAIKEIVMPVDITKKTDDKVRWAIYLAKSFSARVTVISVLDINIDARKSLTYQKALKIENQLTEEGVDCNVLLITETSGTHHEIFLRQLARVKPDLVIIMTHEESILTGDYIGKFALEVIHGAKQPVFNVVPRTGSLFELLDEGFQNH